MNSPVLTVIVPTINRPDTLLRTLQTVVSQDYANLRVIVSDNFSNDNTKDIVESFSGNNITYINPGRRLPMSQHWEFALGHVDEGYVTILGDDDGILPGALKKVSAIINKHQVAAVGWRFGNFNWKGLPPHFMIPMANYYSVVNAKAEIEKVFRESIYNTVKFPSLYGGFIDIQLIKKIKRRYGGYFFHSRIPDFFSGAIVAASVDKYARLEFPVTINATSKHSTGFAVVNKEKEQGAFFALQKGDDNVPFHKSLIFIRSIIVPIAEAMFQVKELVPSFPETDMKKILRGALDEALSTPNIEKNKELKEGIKSIAALNNLTDYVDEMLENAKYNPQPETVKKKFSPVSLSLYIDTTNTDLENVEDACNFAAAVIPAHYTELKSDLFKNYFRMKASLHYVYLKMFSAKRKYL